jgi:hypothetical protein
MSDASCCSCAIRRADMETAQSFVGGASSLAHILSVEKQSTGTALP